ncbi:hypothetical protein KKC91_11865 [bacterium]|nr:hypothetical protein [bacterium]MBU1852853.1 hypothetical protein [Candidatus Omnitrophota bacterium]
MDYILIFHSNLNHGLLFPHKYNLLCEESYLKLINFFDSRYPETKWCLEMSGFTLDYLCSTYPKTPDRLRRSINRNCELVSGPYAHSILANFPYSHGLNSLKFSCQSWKNWVGCTPRVGWIPECGWRQDVPRMFEEAGFDFLICDFDSYVQTRENIFIPRTYAKKPQVIDKYLKIDPDDKDLHFPIRVNERLKGIMRSDRISMRVLKYLQNDLSYKELTNCLDYYSKGEGYLVIYANDAEYLGTTGWFNLQEMGPDRVFEPAPYTFDRLGEIIDYLGKRGNFISISEAVHRFPPRDGIIKIKDGLSWHHGRCSQWDGTEDAKNLNKSCCEIGKMIEDAEKELESEVDREKLLKAWWHLVQAESADGRYPLPPFRPGENNVKYCRYHLDEAKKIVAELDKIKNNRLN